jgi:hypothetical protein
MFFKYIGVRELVAHQWWIYGAGAVWSMQVCTPVAWLALSTGVQGGGVQEILILLLNV